MKYTSRMKSNAEVTIWNNMSKYALKFYDGTDPLNVYEYETDDGVRYSYNLAGEWSEGLTFEELEDTFEEMRLGIDIDAIVNYMDDDIREELHIQLAPCSEKLFIAEYLKRDPGFSVVLSNEFSYVCE